MHSSGVFLRCGVTHFIKNCIMIKLQCSGIFQSKIIFDGAGRQLMHFDESISAVGKAMPGQWILKNKTTYNQYGRSAVQSAYLFDASKKL